jgi:hypothetical protein
VNTAVAVAPQAGCGRRARRSCFREIAPIVNESSRRSFETRTVHAVSSRRACRRIGSRHIPPTGDATRDPPRDVTRRAAKHLR